MNHTELDLVIEAPVSVGLAWALATRREDGHAVRRFSQAWQAASSAAHDRLQQDGGAAADGSPAVLEVMPQVCMPDLDGVGPAYMHTHLLIASHTADGRRVHRELVTRAAPTVQSATSVALRTELDGLPMSKGCATPAGWELDMFREMAEQAPRCTCPAPAVEQVVPLETYAQQLAV